MSLKFFIRLLKGILLGFSILLPGMSGGTMAFILGIYEKLIQEIARFKSSYIKSFLMLFSFQPVKIKKHFLILKKAWDWLFLIPLFCGMFFSVVVFVVFVSDWIKDYSLIFYSLIFGLILGSLIPTFKQIKKSLPVLALFVLSLVLNHFLLSYGKEFLHFPSGKMPDFLFVPVGFLIAMALIVPGISGSYLLLILGLYEKTLFALKQWNFIILICFVLGLLLGFIVTAKGIQKMLKSYWDQSLAVILGLMAGSLSSIYPLSGKSFKIFEPLNWTKEFICFLLCASFGFVCVLLFDYFGNKKNHFRLDKNPK